MKNKIAVYIRVSTTHQIDKESLPFQRRELENYAKYVLNIDDMEFFEDAGYSGKNIMRPAFQSMMSRIRLGEFSHILVWKIDRISRNIIDFANMFEELKKLNVTFVSKNEQFDTSSAIGEAILKIILVFAELERNLTAERVSDVMISRASTGQWNGGRVPLGYNYDKENHTFTVNQQEAEIVKFIFDYYIDNGSMVSLVNALKDKEIKTRTNGAFSLSAVATVLNNIFYTGKYRYNYRKQGDRQQVKPESEWIVIDNQHPAIISEEVFKRAEEIKQTNLRLKNEKGKIVKKNNIHLFANLLECDVCHNNFSSSLDRPRVNQGGYRHSMYNCYGRRIGACKSKYVSDVYLGKFVFNYIANLYKAYCSFGKSTTFETFKKKMLRGNIFSDIKEVTNLEGIYNIFCSKYNDKATANIINYKNTQQDLGNELRIALSEKGKYERALARLKDAYLFSDDAMTQNEYISQKHSIEIKLSATNKKLDKLQSKDDTPFDDVEFLNVLSYFILNQNLQDKREIDFVDFITSVDKKIISDFVHKMFVKFIISKGKIKSMTFRNGITNTFVYDD